MNYFNLVDTIKSVSLNYCEEFYEGDVYEYLNSGNHKYPSVILTTQNVTTADGINTIGATLFCVDRLTDDSSNKLEVQSDMFDRLQRIISTLEENTTNLESNTYTPFTEKFADLCAGMFVEFSLQYVGDTLCDNSIEIKEIELTKNGIYDVIGYDKAVVNVKPKLQDITITANGEYTPQDGVDGFSKVTAEFDTSSLPKVKVSTFKVTNSCINDEGRWEGEQLIDTSEVTSFLHCFSDTRIKRLNASNWNVSKVTSMVAMFSACENLETLDLSSWDVSNVKTLQNTFEGCSKLKSINTDGWDTSKVVNLGGTFSGTPIESLDLSHWNTSNVTNINLMFTLCSKLKRLNTYGWNTSNIINTARPFNSTPLEYVDFRTWDATKMVNLTNGVNGLFYGLGSLTTFIGDVGIDEVITNNVTALNGAKVNIVLTNLKLLDRASLRALINGLADLSDTTAKTLTLGATLRVKLTEEDITIATNKNWTIA